MGARRRVATSHLLGVASETIDRSWSIDIICRAASWARYTGYRGHLGSEQRSKSSREAAFRGPRVAVVAVRQPMRATPVRYDAGRQFVNDRMRERSGAIVRGRLHVRSPTYDVRPEPGERWRHEQGDDDGGAAHQR